MDAPREIELKLLCRPGEAQALFARAAGQPGRQSRLTATYFDTADRRLQAHGLALRVRHDGRRYIQTVKSETLADGALGRGEWESAVCGAVPDRAALKHTPAAKVLGKKRALEAVFTTVVERCTAVREADGACIEVALDLGEVMAGDRSQPICELELELKSGSPAALLGFAARLRKSKGLSLSFASKSERGYALAAGKAKPGRGFRPPPLARRITVGGAFQAIGRAGLEQIVGNAEQLREAPSPQVIHQMRVGARRLRSALSTFKDVVADRRLAAVKAELKWLTGELDPARNLDVLLTGAYARAVKRRPDEVGLTQLGVRLRAARTVAYGRARSAAESERFAALAMDALTWIETGPWTGPDAPRAKARDRKARPFAAKALETRRRKVLKAGRRLGKLSPVDRHHMRIDAKKLRYAADVFAPLFERPKASARFVGALKRLQDDLGALNDIATGEAVTKDLVGDAAITAWAAGGLVDKETRREKPLVRRAEAAVARLADARRFWK